MVVMVAGMVRLNQLRGWKIGADDDDSDDGGDDDIDEWLTSKMRCSGCDGGDSINP